jgi:CubicO group peptidase (beta-lactamase class C family)
MTHGRCTAISRWGWGRQPGVPGRAAIEKAYNGACAFLSRQDESTGAKLLAALRQLDGHAALEADADLTTQIKFVSSGRSSCRRTRRMADTGSVEPVEERIRRIEAGVLAPVGPPGQVPEPAPLADRMAVHNVPGVSIAVIDGDQIAWARGYGVRTASSPEPVTPQTLFQAASISKPVTAAAALYLVQEGRLDLDEDVNRYLTSWKLPANGAWQPRVTLRHLLCHSGGTTVHGFPGYQRERQLPTLAQVLDGRRPANTPAIRVDAVPGTQFRYSGGGTTVMQRLLMDVTGQPFASLMRELILEPLGMRDSTYEQPLPQARWGTAASGHRTGGAIVAGGWHVYPEQAAAGLWTTPSDLARFAVDILRAREGQPGTLLSKATVDQMLAPQVEPYIGLGLFLDGAGEQLRFQHSGDNEGFKCMLVVYAGRRQGAIVMTNGDEGWMLYDEILRTIAHEYAWPPAPEFGWRGELAHQRAVAAVDPQIYAAYVGAYELRPGFHFTVTTDGEALLIQPQGQPPIQIYPLSETQFFARAVNADVRFERSDSGDLTGLVFRQNDRDMFAKRLS